MSWKTAFVFSTSILKRGVAHCLSPALSLSNSLSRFPPPPSAPPPKKKKVLPEALSSSCASVTQGAIHGPPPLPRPCFHAPVVVSGAAPPVVTSPGSLHSFGPSQTPAPALPSPHTLVAAAPVHWQEREASFTLSSMPCLVGSQCGSAVPVPFPFLMQNGHTVRRVTIWLLFLRMSLSL